VPLGTLVRVAGRRWTVEESFQASKGLAGLDQHQVRRWTPWQRRTVLAMLAYAFLTVLAVTERAERPAPAGLISLTYREIHHLFNVLIAQPISDLWHRLTWSTWRPRRARPHRICAARARVPDRPERVDMLAAACPTHQERA
jgi:hypothetical protein